MTRQYRRILAAVSKNGELSLREAIKLLDGKTNTHTDMYPLVMLVEDGYLGITIQHSPAKGTEQMREHSLAMSLHMLRLPKDKDGTVKYRGVSSVGSMTLDDAEVFIRAKGQLYLEDLRRKWEERIVYVLLGILVTVFTQWLLGGLNLR